LPIRKWGLETTGGLVGEVVGGFFGFDYRPEFSRFMQIRNIGSNTLIALADADETLQETRKGLDADWSNSERLVFFWGTINVYSQAGITLIKRKRNIVRVSSGVQSAKIKKITYELN